MTREDYDEHRRRLDEELRVGVELLHSAHAAQVRALDLVWMSAADSAPRPGVPPPPPPGEPAAEKAPRRQPGQLYEEVCAALEQCPESFDRGDLCRLLGYEPNRGSLYRVLQDLMIEKTVAVQTFGSGTIPTKYRKL
jgi:hypothetical protein